MGRNYEEGYCDVCQKSISYGNMKKHINTQNHKRMAKMFKNMKKGGKIKRRKKFRGGNIKRKKIEPEPETDEELTEELSELEISEENLNEPEIPKKKKRKFIDLKDLKDIDILSEKTNEKEISDLDSELSNPPDPLTETERLIEDLSKYTNDFYDECYIIRNKKVNLKDVGNKAEVLIFKLSSILGFDSIDGRDFKKEDLQNPTQYIGILTLYKTFLNTIYNPKNKKSIYSRLLKIMEFMPKYDEEEEEKIDNDFHKLNYKQLKSIKEDLTIFLTQLSKFNLEIIQYLEQPLKDYIEVEMGLSCFSRKPTKKEIKKKDDEMSVLTMNFRELTNERKENYAKYYPAGYC